MNRDSNGNARAIDRLPGFVNANVIYLRTQSKEWGNWEVHSAAKAKRKVRGGAKPGSREMRAPHHALHERIDLRWILKHQARTEEKRGGIRGHASRRRVVDTKVTGDAEPMFVDRDGAAGAILIEAIGIAQPEIRIAYGGVGGLRVRRNSEES